MKSCLLNMSTHLNTSISYVVQQTLPLKNTFSQYIGIGTKLFIWSLLVIGNIQGRKYIIRKCGGTTNAVTFFLKKPDDPDRLHRKPWFILYWLGPVANATFTVLLLVILRSEKDAVKEYIDTTVETFSNFYITLSTSLTVNLLKKRLLELVESLKQSVHLIETYATTRNVVMFFVIYIYFGLSIEFLKSYHR